MRSESPLEQVFDDAQVNLTPEVLARRATMRALLTRTVVRRRRRKHGLQAIAALAVLGLGLWAVIWEGVPADLPPGPATPRYARFDFAIEPTPAAATACVVRSSPIATETYIDDEKLLELLGQAGHKTGIVRVGGKFLLTRPWNPALED